MIVVNKGNFSLRTLEKAHHSPAAPKNTFYADFKVCLALTGEAVWEIEDRTYTICPGDVVFLSIGQKRRFTAFGEKGFQLCALTLARNAFVNPHHFLFFLERAKKDNVLKNCPLSGLLREIYEEWQAPLPGKYELASAKLTEFFVKAQRAENYSLRSVTEANRQMLELMDYIDENVTDHINLQMVAAKAGMTESTFSRHFSAMNGISFQQYVLEQKLQKAITLLRTTDKKMIDVALDSGFDSISGFYAAFKKKTGTTPNKFSALPDWDM